MQSKAIKLRVAANLRRRRHAVALSQEELAFRAGLHRTEISLLERGLRSPALGTIVKLTGCLEVPPAALFEGIAWRPGAPGREGRFEIAPIAEGEPGAEAPSPTGSGRAKGRRSN